MNNAACLNHPTLHPDAWVENRAGRWNSHDNRAAILTCLGCPVAVDCLVDAMSKEGRKRIELRDGIYGGWTPGMRAALARGQRPRWPSFLRPPAKQMLRQIAEAAMRRAAS